MGKKSESIEKKFFELGMYKEQLPMSFEEIIPKGVKLYNLGLGFSKTCDNINQYVDMLDTFDSMLDTHYEVVLKYGEGIGKLEILINSNEDDIKESIEFIENKKAEIEQIQKKYPHLSDLIDEFYDLNSANYMISNERKWDWIVRYTKWHIGHARLLIDLMTNRMIHEAEVMRRLREDKFIERIK